MNASSTRPITIAVLAVGGQGGGVLTKWLVDIAEADGYIAQSTYVAGVAQRTGATIYCVEIYPRARAEAEGRQPVLVQYPVPGDVDIVVAAELAETGRALEKGFVTPNITTLIASSHRIYTVIEKSALGDGIVDQTPVIDAARAASKSFVCFDMAEAADATNSVISAVMLGAISGSDALPFSRDAFESAIRASGRAVESNLAGFAAGYRHAEEEESHQAFPMQADAALPDAVASGPAGKQLMDRVAREFPGPCRKIIQHGALRTLEYQDAAYADAYLERMRDFLDIDVAAEAQHNAYRLTKAIARQLALQMCYEDTIRVAEIKTQRRRLAEIGAQIGAGDGQPFYVSEFFHPRFEEFCDTLPASLGAWALRTGFVKKMTSPLFRSGRNVSTNKIFGFLMLRFIARFRRWRRRTYRYSAQQKHIDEWLAATKSVADRDYDGAVMLALSVQLVSGYGDTYQRGLSRYRATLAAAQSMSDLERAATIERLVAAALADEQGTDFDKALSEAGGTAT